MKNKCQKRKGSKIVPQVCPNEKKKMPKKRFTFHFNLLFALIPSFEISPPILWTLWIIENKGRNPDIGWDWGGLYE